MIDSYKKRQQKKEENEPYNGRPIWRDLGDDSNSNPNDGPNSYPSNGFGTPTDRELYNPVVRESAGGFGHVFWKIFHIFWEIFPALIAIGVFLYLVFKPNQV